MADRYCDYGVYTYSATPTWGIPQEGDGTSKDPSTASATLSWDLSGATAAAGATISVMGAVLTCVASSASTNQFNAGSGTTLIDNIVSAINRTTNTSVCNAAPHISANGWSNTKVQDAVFARRTGNNLELMTRGGSDAYNGNTGMTQSGMTGTIPANPSWSGGNGGCWGWLVNTVPNGAMWPSAIIVGAYSSVSNPISGGYLETDICHVRAKNQFYEFGNNGATAQWTPRGGICVDNVNAIWSDTLNKEVAIGLPATTNYGGALVVIPSGIRTVISARKKGGLVFKTLSTYPNSNDSLWFDVRNAQRHIVFRNVKFYDASGTLTTAMAIRFSFNYSINISASYQFSGCEYTCTRAVSNTSLMVHNGTVSTRHGVLIDDMDFIFPAASGIQPGLFFTGDYGIFRASNVRMSSPATFSLVRKNTSNISILSQVENARGFDIRVANNLGVVSIYGAGSAGLDRAYALQSNVGPDSAFRIETSTHSVDWLPGNQYPYLDSVTPNGTGWSYRWSWTGDTSAWSTRAITPITRFNKRAPTTGGNATRTVRIDLLVPSALLANMTTDLVSIKVAYLSENGMETVQNVAIPLSGDTPVLWQVSSADWNKGAYVGYTPVFIEIATPTAVISGSELSIEVVSSGACPIGATEVFINPNPSVT